MGRKSQRSQRNNRAAAKRRGGGDGGDGDHNSSDDDENEYLSDENNGKVCASAATTTTKLDFAQRRELQRKQAAEKRKLKQKCYLCNKVGHVRRECPGIQDDGRGMSRYKGKSDTKSEKQKYLANNKKNHQKGGGGRGSGSGDGSSPSSQKVMNSLLEYYPEGFLFKDDDTPSIVNDNIDDRKEEEDKNINNNEENKKNTTSQNHYCYYDIGCDYLKTIEYLRYGRGKHKISHKEAIDEYQSILQFSTSPRKQRWKLGSMISRTVLERIDNKDDDRPSWEDPTPSFLLKSSATTNTDDDADEESNTATTLYFMLGLSSKFLNNQEDRKQQEQKNEEERMKEDYSANTEDTEDNNDRNEEEVEMDIVLQRMIDTVNSSPSMIIGIWSSLDYTSNTIRQTGNDRISQLNRLRCCCKAAGETNLPISIQLLPGAAGLTNVNGNGVPPDVKGTDYAKVLLDFQEIAAETIGVYPNIVIVLSCWSGFADHMTSFLKAFSNNLWISLDGSVTFQKLTYLHECAFEVPLDKLLLETSTVIPSCVANVLGRDASYHSGYWPFVVQAVAKYKSTTGCTVEDVANAVAENAIKCYPQLLQRKQ